MLGVFFIIFNCVLISPYFCIQSPSSNWYAGQPPWLLEGSVRDNIVMDSPWCQRRYARVLRATGLRPDLQLLPGKTSVSIMMT